jgi:hypothetical protein
MSIGLIILGSVITFTYLFWFIAIVYCEYKDRKELFEAIRKHRKINKKVK